MSTIQVDTLATSDGLTSASVSTLISLISDVANAQTIEAWLDATTAAVLNDSFNIASSTDHGTGDYSYTLTNAFASLNYSQSGSTITTAASMAVRNVTRDTASVIAVETHNLSAQTDYNHNTMVIGDLA